MTEFVNLGAKADSHLKKKNTRSFYFSAKTPSSCVIPITHKNYEWGVGLKFAIAYFFVFFVHSSCCLWLDFCICRIGIVICQSQNLFIWPFQIPLDTFASSINETQLYGIR